VLVGSILLAIVSARDLDASIVIFRCDFCFYHIFEGQ
jgi:hypothetical protein